MKNMKKKIYKEICKEMVKKTRGYLLLNVEIFYTQKNFILKGYLC